MNYKRTIQAMIALVVIVALLLSACQLDSSQLAGTAASTDQVAAALAVLQAESDGQLDIAYNDHTGAARWVEVEGGGALTRQFARQNLTSDAVAMSFLTTYGSIFGVSDAANVLQLTETETDDAGGQHVGFGQHQNGVDVFGAKLIVHLDNEGVVEVVNGYTVPDADAIDTSPTLTDEAAAQAAIAHTVITDGVAAESYVEIFNPGLITDQATSTYLVYRILVDSPSQPEVAQWVFVDAHTGEIHYSYDAIPDARNRNTYNFQAGTGTSVLVRNEAQTAVTTAPGCTPADVNNAHDFAGQAYDFYFSRFGRDSYDNQGAAINSYVCYGQNYKNATWSNGSATYGEGFVTDDVAAHEFSHGVSQYISGLVGGALSGGLNESFSDIMGEALDLTNGRGNDAASVRWDVGEDIVGKGTLRDMMDPERILVYGFSYMKGTAGEWLCPNRYSNTNALIYTDAHYSSSVQNKAFALMVDGGTYNGYTISPIGLDKAVAIIYRANDLYLTPTSQFRDAYSANNRACRDLYGNGTVNIICASVEKALLATNMNGAFCDGPAAPVTLPMANGDFERGASGEWHEYDSTGSFIIHRGSGVNGSWGAWLGGVDNQTSELWQQFGVPTDGSTLLYSYQIMSEDWPRFDYAYILVNDVQVGAIMLSSDTNTNGFRQSWLDLSAYAGQLITLKFRFKSDSSLTSNFMVDNFSFAQSAFANATDPNLLIDTTQADTKPDGMPGDAVAGKEDQTAPQSPELLRRIFLPLINQ